MTKEKILAKLCVIDIWLNDVRECLYARDKDRFNAYLRLIAESVHSMRNISLDD